MKGLGVFWLDGQEQSYHGYYAGGAAEVTRLHVRYDAEHFPEDLVFQETADSENFQGRYVLRHPWKGEEACEAAVAYRRELPKRLDQEAQSLAALTGWDIGKIRGRMSLKTSAAPQEDRDPWWKAVWKN
jgi:hypothetical protein